jgi:hypothetical protein
VGKDDEDEQDEVSLELDRSGSILSTVEKAGAFKPHLYWVTNIFLQL